MVNRSGEIKTEFGFYWSYNRHSVQYKKTFEVKVSISKINVKLKNGPNIAE